MIFVTAATWNSWDETQKFREIYLYTTKINIRQETR